MSKNWLDQVILRRVIVHNDDDRSIEGTLAMVAADGLVLRAAKLLGRDPVELAGEVFIPRLGILMVQTVP